MSSEGTAFVVGTICLVKGALQVVEGVADVSG
jgi:hypothetical protein